MYLGIDLGTGSVKLLLIDSEGREHIVSRPYSIESPAPGFAETDPEAWLDAVKDAICDLPSLEGLRAIGFSGQMHGIVPVDETCRPLHHAILWADRRGAAYLDRFERLSPEIVRRMENAPVAGMAATSLLWLKDKRPADFSRVSSVLFPKDYLRAVMTGTSATDYSDASGSLLYDFEERSWYGELMDELGLDRSLFPEIRSGLDVAGRITGPASRRFGLPEGLPIAVGSGDVSAAMFGSAPRGGEIVQISVGTASQVSTSIAPDLLPEWSASLNTFEGAAPFLRYRVAAMLNAGIALDWVRSLFRRSWDEVYSGLEARGLEVPLNVVFLPYLTGERTPYMDPEARGSWTGLSLHNTEYDLFLAALLGVACAIRLGYDTLNIPSTSRIRAVGGSLQYPYWRRLLATVIGRDISISDQTNISARGAALIAAAALGEEVAPPRDEVAVIEPEKVAWIEDYYRSFKELYKRLHNA